MTVIIKNLAIGGYRSFGSTQYFPNFNKINLFIGRNNSGKSNVLRFINKVLASGKKIDMFKPEQIDRHIPNGGPLIIGLSSYPLTEKRLEFIAKKFNNNSYPRLNISHQKTINEIYTNLDNIQNNYSLVWTLFEIPTSKSFNDEWELALKNINDNDLYDLWRALTNQSSGGRSEHWVPGIIRNLKADPPEIKNSKFIPAIRQVSITDNDSEYDGSGIINKLAKLQNPDVHNQDLRRSFSEINDFVKSVLDREDARIEIPYERDTILVHMDNKVLPLDSLGTGVHEVIILAAAATTLNNSILCIEEPELHLNPILQRKLLKYLSDKTSNQYFITTHSPAIMDTQGAEIYHITQSDGESKVTRATSDRMKSDACEDLGYHPSDLLQTNCVIWVEGPSDRIYIKYWLKHLAPEFTEGINYSIMFYGGRLLSHLSGEENEMALEEFISLRKLNQRGVIVIDSDKEKPRSQLNDTKKRLISEFDKGPGFSWVTAGREIENYFSEEELKFGIKASSPRCSFNSTFGRYENCLKIKGERGADTQASKTDVAHSITKKFSPNLDIYDLKEKINNLVKFIKKSNPAAKA